jgi:rod shape determining protein RodA
MRRFLSFRDFDWTLLAMVLGLCAISVFEIYSATLHTKYVGYHTKQMFWIAGGLAAMFLFSRIDYHRLLDWVPWAYGVFLLLLVAVKLVGHKALGARRWIKIGPMHFQPSEWVKLILILARGPLLCQPGRAQPHLEGHLQSLCAGRPSHAAGTDPARPGNRAHLHAYSDSGPFSGRHQSPPGPDSTDLREVLIAGAWSSGKVLKPYQKDRLTSFINPGSDPRGTGYQLLQSKIAVGSGGIWGKGAAKGTQTQGNFLPIPHADFIFAAFSEEHGFVGALFVLLLYFFILMRLIQNAQTAADLPGSLIIMGVVAVLTFQIAVNVGMVIGFMPVTGIPLPLMSYGGSSVLFTFLALGAAMNVRMRRFVN